MSIQFKTSQTCANLMRAFAGESQARNRYTFAAAQAKQAKLAVLEQVFKFTANQEKEHAEIFYQLMQSVSGDTVSIDGAYPVDIYKDLQEILRTSQHNEFEEFNPVYPAFAKIASEEGFAEVATKFHQIAKIEQTHGERFGLFAKWMSEDKLFREDQPVKWLCLNCGHVHEGTEAPRMCPVCSHDQGFFVREAFAPFTAGSGCQ